MGGKLLISVKGREFFLVLKQVIFFLLMLRLPGTRSKSAISHVQIYISHHKFHLNIIAITSNQKRNKLKFLFIPNPGMFQK